jgi:hypothetical protein
MLQLAAPPVPEPLVPVVPAVEVEPEVLLPVVPAVGLEFVPAVVEDVPAAPRTPPSPPPPQAPMRVMAKAEAPNSTIEVAFRMGWVMTPHEYHRQRTEKFRPLD